MAEYGLHWTEKQPDPNIRPSAMNVGHANPIRMSSETIVELLTLKSQLLGAKLDILKEAEAFSARYEV